MSGVPVPPKQLEQLLGMIRAGATAFVSTPVRVTTIDAKALAKWEKAGMWLLREEGDGYRMRSGRNSFYLFPGQLRVAQ